MKCACGGRTDAIDGRYVEQGYWRQRICQVCGEKSTTIEQLCVTEKGNRVRAAKLHVPKAPVVKLPRQRDATHRPTKKGKAVLDARAERRRAKTVAACEHPETVVDTGCEACIVGGEPVIREKTVTQPVAASEPAGQSARSRIEDRKMARELGLGE